MMVIMNDSELIWEAHTAMKHFYLIEGTWGAGAPDMGGTIDEIDSFSVDFISGLEAKSIKSLVDDREMKFYSEFYEDNPEIHHDDVDAFPTITEIAGDAALISIDEENFEIIAGEDSFILYTVATELAKPGQHKIRQPINTSIRDTLHKFIQNPEHFA